MSRLATDLRTTLKDALPDTWKVVGYVPVGTRPDRTTVAVWTTSLEHLDAAPNGTYLTSFTVAITTAHQDQDKADDALDDALRKVLLALWAAPAYRASSAERQATNDQTLHAWVLTVQAGIAITEEN